MTKTILNNENNSFSGDDFKKTTAVLPLLFSFFQKKLVRKFLFGIFLGVIIVLTLMVSFRIALHRVRKSEYAMTRGTDLLMSNRFEEALWYFEEALEGNSRKKLAWLGKGLCFMYLKRYDESLKSYEKLIKIDPDNAQSWRGKAMSLEYLGRFNEALESYNRTLEINPNFESVIIQRKKLIEKIQNSK